MKKFFALIVILIGFVSCTKGFLEINTDEVSTISFTIDVFKQGTPITKALDNDAIIDAIKLGFPKYYNLKIANVNNNNVYYLSTDKEITLPNGVYEVVDWNNKNGDRYRWDSIKGGYNNKFGHRCDDEFMFMFCSGGVVFCNSPKITINQTIEVKSDGNIILNGTIESSAIVWDSNIIEKIEICDNFDTYDCDLKCFVKKNNICVTFHDKSGCHIKVYPYSNANYEKKTFDVSGDLIPNNYYVILLDEVTNSTSDVGVSVGDFSNGGTL